MIDDATIAQLTSGLASISQSQASARQERQLLQRSLTSSDPNIVIPHANRAPGRIHLPQDTPMYYTLLKWAPYKRRNWDEVGNLDYTSGEAGMAALPIPRELTDAHSVRIRDDNELGAIGAGVMSALGSGDIVQKASDTAQAMLAGAIGLTKTAAEYLSARALGDVGSSLVKKSIGGSQAAQGWGVNNFMTVMLDGPEYKKFSMEWEIHPNSATESSLLADLYNEINKAQSPGLAGPLSAFFTYPCIFEVAFCHQSTDPDKQTPPIFQFKKCMLRDSSWWFSSGGAPAFFEGTHAPTGCRFKLDFVELEYWLKSDEFVNRKSFKTFGGGGDNISDPS